MINTLRASSRSVVTDQYYGRMRDHEMKTHRERLEQIQKGERHKIVNLDHKHHRKQLKKNKSAAHRIEQVFDPTSLNNRALVTHITEIKKRKSEHGLSLKVLHSHRHAKEEQQKEIKRQNKKLIMAILQQKSKFTSRKDLKKEFKMYEEQRDKIRKVKSKSHL